MTSQGCSDSGVCYVPHEQFVRVSLPTGVAAPPRASTSRNLPWGWIALGAGGLLLAPLAWSPAGRRTLRRIPRASPLAGQVGAVVVLAALTWLATLLWPGAGMALWGSWLIIAAVMLGALEPLPHAARWPLRLAKALGIGMLVWGIVMLIGALAGGREPLQPLAPWRAGIAETVSFQLAREGSVQ